eukprot:5188736-Ditylum_brightwellii.AAC.1
MGTQRERARCYSRGRSTLCKGTARRILPTQTSQWLINHTMEPTVRHLLLSNQKQPADSESSSAVQDLSPSY